MSAKASRKPEDFIVPLNMNGLEGRMMRVPASGKSNREILFLYGQHSSLERWWGIAAELSKFGNLTMPDFPGLGGMTPLYKLGRKPDIDTMADYLASFIKLKYRNKKVMIIGMSLGFVIVTRMLQRYPELVKKVDILVSVVGFAHGSDLIFTKKRLFIYRNITRFLSMKWPAWLFHHIALNPFFIRLIYARSMNAKEKFDTNNKDVFKEIVAAEVELWKINDSRTQFIHYLEMFSLDNTRITIGLPVYHVAAKNDRFFDNNRVEEHMRRIFKDFEIFYTSVPNHAPTVIATAAEAAPFFPPALRKKFK